MEPISHVTRQTFIALNALRAIPALLIVVHGATRIASGGVHGFGTYLSSQHIPFGSAVAWTLSVAEVLGGLSLAAGILVIPLCVWFAVELLTGIILVHAPEGWFVVGGGRNGMEYSVLLVSCFVINALLAPFVSRAREPKSASPAG